MESGAPSEIGRNIIKKLLEHQDELPFTEIKLFCKEKYAPKIRSSFKNIDVITSKNLNKISKHDLVHIPILPTILPNAKFLLYLYVKVINRGKLVIQYHGDVRKELKSSYKDSKSLVHILTYIFIPTLLKSVDRVIVHSYYMNKIINKYGAKKCEVIPNAIDNYWHQNGITEQKNTIESINKHTFKIFYHGRLSWEKGIDILLDSIGNYIKNNPNTMVYLAGEGPLKKTLEDLCLKYGINRNVVFLGNLDKEQIKFFLKNVDIAIYPSRFDSFSLAVLEALACANCPVYFSKDVGIYDFIIQDGFTLNSFEPNSENIINILNSIPFDVNKNTVNYQKEFAKNYTWDSIIHRYIKLYYEVLN